MKQLKGLIFYMVLIIATIFCINYLYNAKGFLTVEISNIKAKSFELQKTIDNLGK
jgi:hypothetical protein